MKKLAIVTVTRAVDDCVRHAVTKLSYLHFSAAEEYRRRIIQMGEAGTVVGVPARKIK